MGNGEKVGQKAHGTEATNEKYLIKWIAYVCTVGYNLGIFCAKNKTSGEKSVYKQTG